MSSLSLLLGLLGLVFIIATGVIILNLNFQRNLFRQQLAREALISSHQQELLRSSIQVQEEERKRIAANLHDELGALLSIARMRLITLEEQDVADKGGQVAALKDIRSLTETSLSTMRRISHELMPQNLQLFGLYSTLEHIAGLMNDEGGITLQVLCAEETTALPWELSLGLYRICLELINNTIRHSQASQAYIRIQQQADMLTLHYSDNGTGIGVTGGKPGLGHKNMEARALAMGAALKTGNLPEGGFYALVQVLLPSGNAVLPNN